MVNRRAAVAGSCLAIVLIAVALVRLNSSEDPSWLGPAPLPLAIEDRQRGGSVRVAVASPPEVTDKGIGGATLRQLTMPSLFVAQPDGNWNASLVEPGSDSTSTDASSARFKLRDAQWSDGSAISVADLRRNLDARFVRDIEDPTGEGVITVNFTQRFPQWRQLWSGAEYVTASDVSLTAGPYRIKSVTSGFETVLERNGSWFGKQKSQAPFLDEVRLVAVTDAVMARQLLHKGEVDVAAPQVSTRRTAELAAPDISVSVATQSGWWTGLRLGATVSDSNRKAVASLVPRREFREAILAEEAEPLDGFGTSDHWKSGPVLGSGRVDGARMRLTFPVEEPSALLLEKSVTRAIERAGGVAEPGGRNWADVRSELAENSYDVVLDGGQFGPSMCWQCVFEGIDSSRAREADEGNEEAQQELQKTARESARFLPLWSPKSVVGFRTSAVSGVQANGFAPGSAWGAEIWFQP